MAKTYLPGLYYAMKALNKYATTWQAQMGAVMSPAQATALAKVLVCLAEALPLFIPPPPIE